MAFLVKIIFYSFWAVTAVLCIFYLFSGLNFTAKNNPLFIRQGLALVSIYGLYKVYRAYQSGEQQHRFAEAMYHLGILWLLWAILLLIYLAYLKWYS